MGRAHPTTFFFHKKNPPGITKKGVSSSENGGYPPTGVFFWGKSHEKWMMTGGTPMTKLKPPFNNAIENGP